MERAVIDASLRKAATRVLERCRVRDRQGERRGEREGGSRNSSEHEILACVAIAWVKR